MSVHRRVSASWWWFTFDLEAAAACHRRVGADDQAAWACRGARRLRDFVDNEAAYVLRPQIEDLGAHRVLADVARPDLGGRHCGGAENDGGQVQCRQDED